MCVEHIVPCLLFSVYIFKVQILFDYICVIAIANISARIQTLSTCKY